MNYNAKFKPYLCTSDNEHRPTLHHTFLDKKAECLIATDGRRLVSVPVALDEHDSEGYVTKEAMVAASKLCGKGMSAEIKSNGKLELANGQVFPRPTTDEIGYYPAWRQVIPVNKTAFRSSFNPKFLAEVAQAIGEPERVTVSYQPTDSADVEKLFEGMPELESLSPEDREVFNMFTTVLKKRVQMRIPNNLSPMTVRGLKEDLSAVSSVAFGVLMPIKFGD